MQKGGCLHSNIVKEMKIVYSKRVKYALDSDVAVPGKARRQYGRKCAVKRPHFGKENHPAKEPEEPPHPDWESQEEVERRKAERD